ncbi:MAG TPA: DUF3343 domain-containing protein [Syntrophomonas sp.]|jgi:hypothetical protein|nr:DUF3343 domain-containing protein [Syntrophomonas sp.]
MDSSLFDLAEFYLYTFVSTSNALKAESVLKNEQADFITIPTLREISSSCGLSIKIRPEHIEEYRLLLQDNKVAVEKIYHVNKVQKKYRVEEYKA